MVDSGVQKYKNDLESSSSEAPGTPSPRKRISSKGVPAKNLHEAGGHITHGAVESALFLYELYAGEVDRARAAKN
jgi:hypothetical protein